MAKVIQFPVQEVSPELVWCQAAGAEFVAEQHRPETDVYPKAIPISEMPGDRELVRETRKQLLALKTGELVMPETIETKVKPIKNLHEAILWASEDDAEGREMVRANVSTQAMETLIKAGNYKRIDLATDEDGDVSQHGQRLKDIHKNAWRYASNHPVLADRTLPEANNGARIERLNKQGLLEDNYFVVFSLCAEGLSDEELDELLFFSTTKSMSIQATSSENGSLFTETAFVAGVAEEGAARHDREAVEAIAEGLGTDYSGYSTAEIIDRPLLIPKSQLPGGVIDLVKLLDQMKGTFFGQNKPVQDYEKFKEFCIQREAEFSDDVDQITDQLVIEANILNGPAQASKRMAKLVEERMVQKAVEDESIETWVFGTESANNIEQARLARMQGNQQEANKYEQKAIETAQSGACTAGSCGLESISLDTDEGKLLREKVKAEDGDIVLRDTERVCRCGRKGTIIYAYNKNKVNKYCEGCHAFESKASQKAQAA